MADESAPLNPTDFDSLLERLNDKQREAVEALTGPMLILAGAGSGKTRVLTHRIAYLLRYRGARPWDILAVTFTNKASQEMAHRVARLLPEIDDLVPVSTFHSAAARILRRHIDRLGYASDFVIYDDSDQRTLIRRVLEELKIDKKAHNPGTFRQWIDQAKNQLQWPGDVEVNADGSRAFLPAVYKRYQERLKEMNVLDFGDLLLLTVRVLEENKDVRDEYHRRIKHLLIDEYQDTNRAQYRIAQLLLNPETRSICVVGDEDQSIYAFRGADIQNILNFEKDFPDARVIKLEQNYRSTCRILDAAGAVVENNAGRIGKNLWSNRGDGEFIRYLETDTDYEEAARVAEEIQRLHSRNYPFEEMAVFYRANFQSRLLEEVFNLRQLPYVLVGQGFYDRKEIKDIRAYLQLIYNPSDDISLERILNVPTRGIGARARLFLLDGALERGMPCYHFLRNLALDPKSHKPYGTKLAAFFRIIEKLRETAKTLTVPEIIDHVLERSGYREKLVQAGDIESESRLENLRELVNVAVDLNLEPGMEGLATFLERISLRSQVDDADDTEGRITLMTLHNAKGLEFPIVFMIGMEEKLFPHARMTESETDLEEERRLCYVGMTRAMDRLFLLRARRRRIHGERVLTRPSRFLTEIPPTLMKGRHGISVGKLARQYGMVGGSDSFDAGPGVRSKDAEAFRQAPKKELPPSWKTPANLNAKWAEIVAGNRKKEPVAEDPLNFDGDPSREAPLEGPFRDLRVGQRVMHPTYGEGMIRKREGPADNPRLLIRFRAVGEKRFLARYANLELVF